MGSGLWWPVVKAIGIKIPELFGGAMREGGAEAIESFAKGHGAQIVEGAEEIAPILENLGGDLMRSPTVRSAFQDSLGSAINGSVGALDKIGQTVEQNTAKEAITEIQGLIKSKQFDIAAQKMGDLASKNLIPPSSWSDFNAVQATIEQQAQTLKQVEESVVSGTNRQFVNKYLSLDPNEKKAFLLNDDNYNRFQALRGKGLKDLLAYDNDYTKAPFFKSISGLTTGDKIKNWLLGVGVPAGAIVGASKVLDVFDWFSSNHTQTSYTAEELLSELGGLEVTGDGVQIIEAVKQSLNNINNAAQSAHQAFANDPQTAIQSYLTVCGKEVISLNNALGQWGAVVSSCSDQSKAQKVGNDLAACVKGLVDSYTQLAQKMGIDVPSTQIATPQAPKGVSGIGEGPVVKDLNIVKIQGFLSTFGVQPTGVLDKPTIDALRELEGQLNERGDTHSFSGAFVVPELHWVVKYDALMEALRRIQKY